MRKSLDTVPLMQQKLRTAVATIKSFKVESACYVNRVGELGVFPLHTRPSGPRFSGTRSIDSLNNSHLEDVRKQGIQGKNINLMICYKNASSLFR